MRIRVATLLLPLLILAYTSSSQHVREITKGKINFNSDAPNEIIKASSDKLKGVLDLSKKTFAFKVAVASFEGFNSPLQKEHFNENYMESFNYPEITFAGKIIEDVNLAAGGVYKIRAKGKLDVHGVPRERIINVTVQVKDETIVAMAAFTVALADHNIKIPRVVYDKLATEVNITVYATMKAVK